MKDLHHEQTVKKFQPLSNEDHTDTNRELSLFSIVLITFLLLGVPVLFAINTFVEWKLASLIVYPLLLTFLLSVALNYNRVFKNVIHVLFYVFFAILVLSSVFAKTIFTTINIQFGSLYLCFIWFSVFISIYYIVRTKREYKFSAVLMDIIGLLILTSVLLSYIGPKYLGFSFGEISYSDNGIRAFGPFGDQVGFALGYFVLRSFVRGRWISVVFYVIAILSTGTRGAILSVALGVLWLIIQMIVRRQEYYRIQFRVILISLLVLASSISFLYSSYGENTLVRLGEALQNQDSLYQRKIAIQLGVAIYFDNPVLGVGYLGFNRLGEAYNFNRYTAIGGDAQRGLFTAQNQFVQTATDAGTLGLFFLLLLLWMLFRELKRGYLRVEKVYEPDLIAATAWLIALVLGNQAAVWILPATITGYIFALVMGLSLALIGLHKPTSQPSMPVIQFKNH